MSFTSAEQREVRRKEAMSHMMWAGMQGAVPTAMGVTLFHFGAEKFIPAYKRFAMSPKLFWLSSTVVAAYWIAAERAHLARMDAINDAAAEQQAVADEERRRGWVLAQGAQAKASGGKPGAHPSTPKLA